MPASERAYRHLKRLILDNELPAGTQVLELEAAARLGMSRTPVREAMVRLAQEGMVDLRPRHGMRVRPISAAALGEIYEVLRALEGIAAESVARRGPTPAEIVALSEALEVMERALAADDLRAWLAADDRFHRMIVRASGNGRLATLAGQIADQSHRARMLTLPFRPKPVDSNREHAALVAAIVARDAEGARRILDRHRHGAATMLVALVDRLGLKQL